jgi:putative protein-disulfide isomerase
MVKISDSLNNIVNKVDRVEIEYFTDPLCCWSWAFEPHWRRFINDNKHHIAWRYRMGGMLADWNTYNDPLNDISRPAQMAPLWLQTKYSTHTEIDPDIWLEDPPATSLTACMAVKCAELQSAAAGDMMLIYLRKAVMTRKKNIARKQVILDMAEEMASIYPAPDFEKFKTDFEQNKALTQLKEDLQITKLNNIGRFPTIIMRNPMQTKGLIITGYRPYEVLTEAFNQLNDVLTHQD